MLEIRPWLLITGVRVGTRVFLCLSQVRMEDLYAAVPSND